jgi:hypothetical protein
MAEVSVRCQFVTLLRMFVSRCLKLSAQLAEKPALGTMVGVRAAFAVGCPVVAEALGEHTFVEGLSPETDPGGGGGHRGRGYGGASDLPTRQEDQGLCCPCGPAGCLRGRQCQ